MKLFESTNLGSLKLKNRIVMAPMTRSRATNNIPNDMMVKYYSDRASAGLIITEGTSPSPNGLGYPRIPGMFSEAQSVGWKKVTTAVHKNGGAIFIQLMHTGRTSHPDNLPPGAKPLAPSAIRLSGQMWTDTKGMQDYPTPNQMTETDIKHAISEYVESSVLAIKSGFDGVELHSANGYLMDQFLNPASNQRTDSYGGTPEGRQRFVLEVAEQVSKRIGKDKTGMRISPYGVFNDMASYPEMDNFFIKLTEKLSQIGLVYIHIVDHSSMGAPIVKQELKHQIRANFKGTTIISGGYTSAEQAERDLLEDKGDLVAFGRPFIANPNLVELLKTKQPLKQPDSNKFYTPGEEGYTDY